MAHVYIMTNAGATVLYTGSTIDLVARVLGHKSGVLSDAFTLKYKCFKLVWHEELASISDARQREYRIKRWRRDWKIRLIEELNPQWLDLSDGW